MPHTARQAVRYPAELAVCLKGGGLWLPSTPLRARDISHGGLFVCTHITPEFFCEFPVTVHLPWGGDLTAEARVVHVVPPEKAKALKIEAGVGFEFIDLNRAQKEQIQRLVQWARSSTGHPRIALRTPKPAPGYLNPLQHQVLGAVDGRRSENEIAQCVQVNLPAARDTLIILNELDLVWFDLDDSDDRPTLPDSVYSGAGSAATRVTARPLPREEPEVATQRPVVTSSFGLRGWPRGAAATQGATARAN